MEKDIKNKIVKLRQQGKTFKEILEITSLDIPKSTLSYLCRNISTPKGYAERVRKINLENLKEARINAVLVNKQKQEKICRELENINNNLANYINTEVCKLLLSMLYLGEGSKYISTRSLRLGSSSPLIIKLYLKLLNKCFPISNNKFRVTIQCRADQSIPELESFWQSITNINYNQFYKTRIDQRTINKKTKKNNYMGVCVIDYFDTKIQLELELLSSLIEKWV